MTELFSAYGPVTGVTTFRQSQERISSTLPHIVETEWCTWQLRSRSFLVTFHAARAAASLESQNAATKTSFARRPLVELRRALVLQRLPMLRLHPLSGFQLQRLDSKDGAEGWRRNAHGSASSSKFTRVRPDTAAIRATWRAFTHAGSEHCISGNMSTSRTMMTMMPRGAPRLTC